MAVWPEGESFIEELNRLNKPSSSKINSLADQALSLHRHYKNVVHAIEKYVRKSTRDTRLLGLYIIDSLLRKSRAKYGGSNDGAGGPSKDVFASRLSNNMLLTFAKLIQVRSVDLDRVKRILDYWKLKEIFSAELIEEMEAIYQSAAEAGGMDETDEEEEERRGSGGQKAERNNASPVPPTGEESPDAGSSPARKPAMPLPPKPAQPPQPQTHSQVAATVRDPRRAAQHPPPAAAPSFPAPPPPPPAFEAAPGSALAALANLQSRLTSPHATPAAMHGFPQPGAWPATVPAAAPAPAFKYPAPPPPPPPAATDDSGWDYDDEEDEDEDEESRKEKLRIRLDQEKARMEAAALPPPPVQQQQQQQSSYPTPSLAGAAPSSNGSSAPAGASAPPRRSRFSAPKSAAEVEAEMAAAAGGYPAASPALAHAGSSGSGSYRNDSRFPNSPAGDDSRRRSRSRSRERDLPNARGERGNATGGGGGGGRQNQSSGFVRLPDSEQQGSIWVKVLSTTLRVGHAPLTTLRLEQRTLQNQLREGFERFGQVDWLNVTETQSYVRFRTRRSAAIAKAASENLSVGGSPARLSWARAKEMEKDMGWRQDTGEGAISADHATLKTTQTEDPDLEVDEDWAARKNSGAAGGGGGGGGGHSGGPRAPREQQQQQPQSHPMQQPMMQMSSGYQQPMLAASPAGYAAAGGMVGAGNFNAQQSFMQSPMAGGYAQPFSPTGAGMHPMQQQAQMYPQMMQPMQQMQQQQQQPQQPQQPSGGTGAFVHPSRGQLPWMQQQQQQR